MSEKKKLLTKRLKSRGLVPLLKRLTHDRNKQFYKYLVMCFKPEEWVEKIIKMAEKDSKLTSEEMGKLEAFNKYWLEVLGLDSEPKTVVDSFQSWMEEKGYWDKFLEEKELFEKRSRSGYDSIHSQHPLTFTENPGDCKRFIRSHFYYIEVEYDNIYDKGFWRRVVEEWEAFIDDNKITSIPFYRSGG